MIAQTLGLWSLRSIAAALGGMGVFMTWASCYASSPIEGEQAIIGLLCATVITLGVEA